MDKYTIYCSPEQTKNALELGALIINYPIQMSPYGVPKYERQLPSGKWIAYIIPTAEQMIGWLRAKGFKFILSDAIDGNEGNNWWIGIKGELITQGFSENKELAAIDAALEYLSDSNYDKI